MSYPPGPYEGSPEWQGQQQPGWQGQQPGWQGQQPDWQGQQPGWPGQQPGWPGQQPGWPGQRAPDNYLVWAILTTVFCCLPLGIVSIMYSTKVSGLWSQGRYAEAQAAADNAKKWAIISAIVGAVVGVIVVILFFFMFTVGVSNLPSTTTTTF
ncbi:MAG TPA: CD225/dispanin family protein, partial [Mycobacterium sp.]|nr:CD225/dispanin family protein [Mycobacterium sp.]